MRARHLVVPLLVLALGAVAPATVAAAPLAAPAAPAASLVIGAYEFPESLIMAELYAGVLREAGQKVTIVTARNRTLNQHGETVQVMVAKMLVPRRPAA
jgi:osmoprotectant transport system substrate-binding protein